MTLAVTGMKELTRTLDKLGDPKAVKRVARSGITKGLRVLAKSVKAQIPPKYKEAKKGIGSRFAKPKTRDGVEARVGVGVGISKKRMANLKKKDRGKKPGVGASAQNLHWFILGTVERKTGAKTRKRRNGSVSSKPTGNAVRRTGKMPPQQEVANIIRDGMAAGEAAATAKIIDGVKQGIEREVAKAKK